jgi:S-ribosylhomocysteine lyase
MNKITSFTIDHRRLLPGIYVSRKDHIKGQTLTTFDLRFTRPNYEPVMDTAGVHAIEHLGATYLRNDPVWGQRTIYFGPMGCRTGFYVIFAGDLESEDVLGIIRKMCEFIISFQGKIPGASAEECGNYQDLNLDMAKYYTNKYLREFLNNPRDEQLHYPG